MKLSPLAIGMGVGAAFAAALWFVGSVSHTSVRSAGPVAVTVASPATAPAPSAAAKTNLQTFFVRGVVKEVKADGNTVVIDHEEIPNYMAKMVMPFKVKDTNQLAGLGTNDQIHFRFNVAEYESWIDQVMAELPEEAAPERIGRGGGAAAHSTTEIGCTGFLPPAKTLLT